MEMKFDPSVKVKQGDLNKAPDGKQPNRKQLISTFLKRHLEKVNLKLL